jgi:hypothetical protein
VNTLGFRTKVVLAGFLLIAGFFLVTEHTAHVFGVLPFLFLLACPFMHIFLHGRHGEHGGDSGPNAQSGRGHDHA